MRVLEGQHQARRGTLEVCAAAFLPDPRRAVSRRRHRRSSAAGSRQVMAMAAARTRAWRRAGISHRRLTAPGVGTARGPPPEGTEWPSGWCLRAVPAAAALARSCRTAQNSFCFISFFSLMPNESVRVTSSFTEIPQL